MTVLDLQDAAVWVPSGQRLLDGVTWTVRPGEHWLVLGPNGAGKSTLLSLAAAQRHPSAGTVRLLGELMGRVDVFTLRRTIGVVDADVARRTRPAATALEVVRTAGTFVPDGCSPAQAADLLVAVGCAVLADRPFGRLSQGERARVLLARALAVRPRLLLLDEAASGLDLPGRELLLAAVARAVAADPALVTVTVTHHVEEAPAAVTHALLLREGRVVAAGPVDEVLGSGALAAAFDLPVLAARSGDRWTARLA